MTNTPFENGYGYPDEFRLAVCKLALSKGIKSAASFHNVSTVSVRNWLRAYTTHAILKS